MRLKSSDIETIKAAGSIPAIIVVQSAAVLLLLINVFILHTVSILLGSATMQPWYGWFALTLAGSLINMTFMYFKFAEIQGKTTKISKEGKFLAVIAGSLIQFTLLGFTLWAITDNSDFSIIQGLYTILNIFIGILVDAMMAYIVLDRVQEIYKEEKVDLSVEEKNKELEEKTKNLEEENKKMKDALKSFTPEPATETPKN